MSYLFTSESVSEGHPDKISDRISDAILDEFLSKDPESKVACETLCTTGLVVVSGEVKSKAYVDIQGVVRRVIEDIGYCKADYQFESKSCGVLSTICEQSPDINQGVDREDRENQGAGDQGIMFGYAVDETSDFMPASITLAHILMLQLAEIRREGKVMTYLRPDSKSQVTIEYDDNDRPKRVHTIVISTQHDDNVSQEQIRDDIQNILIPRVKERLKGNGDHLLHLITNDYILHVNPTGKFVIGGPAGDTGLTGRKIIVDTYGGHGAHGGGAFSGKDSSKVDRSATYAARYIAKNMVAAGISNRVQIQVAYAIGVAQPVSVYVNTFGNSKVHMTDGEIAQRITQLFDLRPAKIVEKFGLKNPIFEPTSAYGHFGRDPYVENGMLFFGWERLDSVDMLKEAFKLN